MAEIPFTATVDFDQPVEVVFDYLADPKNRPAWQASLLSVRLPRRDSTPAVGLRWRETTVVGVRPRMEITVLERPTRWAERGTWAGVSASLALGFGAADPDRGDDRGSDRGSVVTASGLVSGRGPWSVPARLGGTLAGRAIAFDLRRANRILGGVTD